ncbi:hypothetical protein J2T11_000150 [Paenarthrobacter nicotinovorans]|uniref:hypothetical protein n=1 Tax=Paenarthrobacter nicotinovorans TaxID=29320 RepID=UPI00278760EF|nr:hypothetical protein [Paenarthrobacter nicotinovorans]MDP9933826.1 hypothetical protein [Paenarthrobacter nicotinovorans]
MTSFTDAEAVTDEAERAAVGEILSAFVSFREWEATLSQYSTVQHSSPLSTDDAALQSFPVSQFAYAQLVVAFGCLQSLRQMMVDEDGENIHVTSGPYGPYTLIRNALDSAACALWLLEPANSKLRIKRRIMVQMGEIHLAFQFRQEMNLPSHQWNRDYRARMQEVADQANIGTFDVSRNKMPQTTSMLKSLERLNTAPLISWLGAWQLCSGHAHGKQWATLMSNELTEIARSATDLGAQYRITLSYANLALVMASTAAMIQVACERYSLLAKTAPA